MTNSGQLRYFFWVLMLLLIFPMGFLFMKPARKMNVNMARSFRSPVALTVELPILTEVQESRPVQPRGSRSFDRKYVASINFYGAAKPQSKINEGSLMLVASGEAKWAYAKLDFREQVNIGDNSITFLAKGALGREILKIALADANRRTAHMDELYSIELTTDWQKITIGAEEIKTASIDRSRIAYIKFVIDSVSPKKEGGRTIYIKDFAIK